MKAQSIAFYSVAAALALTYTTAHNDVFKITSRNPASTCAKAPAKKPVAKKKVVTNNEMKQMKEKLAQLEAELKSKNDKDKEIDSLKNEIADLKSTIKDTKVKDNDEMQTALCLSKRHEAELEEQIKKQLLDKEDILKQFESFKAEMKSPKAPAAPVASVMQPANDNIIALLGQITSLLQSQQQMQMQFQTQMFSMFPQQNNNNNFAQAYSSVPSLSNSVGMYGPGMGIGFGGFNNIYAPAQQIQNPYSDVPMQRNQIPFSSGFSLNPSMPALSIGGGFNFNNSAPAMSDSFAPRMSLSQTI
jgi:hypothetical protein